MPAEPPGRPARPRPASPGQPAAPQPGAAKAPAPRPSAPPPAAAVPEEVLNAPPSEHFGKFVRTKKLGAGGMGEVWKAWDRELRRWVALKLLKGGDDEEIARFKREAQMAGKLSHPNIAAIYEVGQAQERHYIAMQFIDGETLRDFPRKDRRGIARLIRDAARAVALAHQQGLVHRDLKPENLMAVPMEGEGRGVKHHVYVMDFGLARPAKGDSNVSLPGLIIGTPSYMSPEQARADRLDRRADVYSLGATLYDLLTGRLPFAGKGMLSILRKVQEDDPIPPRKIDPSIDADLETIVLKCMEKDRARRYGSALELADDLDRWLQSDPIHARPASLAYRLKKKLLKRKALSVTLAGGAAALLLILTLLIPQWRKANAERADAQKLQKAMEELNGIWMDVVATREWTRQPFRNPADIRASFQKSEAAISAFIQSHEQMPQGWYVRARARLPLSDFAGAEADARRSTELEPNFAPGWRLLAQILLEWRQRLLLRFSEEEDGNPAAKQRLYEQAQDAVRKGQQAAATGDMGRWGLSRTPEDATSEVIAAATKAWVVDHDAAGSVERLKAALKAAPSEDCCRTLSLILQEPDEQLVWLNRAIEIATHDGRARFLRATLRNRKGDWAGVIEDLDRSLEMDPHQYLAYALRAEARTNKGDFEGALADCKKAIGIDGTSAMAYIVMGTARQLMGDAPGAIADFDKAISLRPRSILAFLRRGNARRATGDASGAIADFQRCIDLNPKLAGAYYNIGGARGDQGDTAGALEAYAKAIAADPKFFDAYLNRTALLRDLKRFDEAIRDLDAGLQIDPRHEALLRARASVKYMKADYEGAIADFTLVIDNGSVNPDAYYWRGQSRAQRGDLAGAQADIEKALAIAPAAWQTRAMAVEDLEKIKRAR